MSRSSPITCHGELACVFLSANHLLGFRVVLDSSIGKPAEGIEVTLQILETSTSGDAVEVFRSIAQGYIGRIYLSAIPSESCAQGDWFGRPMYWLTAASWFGRDGESSDRLTGWTNIQDKLQNKTVFWKNGSDVILSLGRSTCNYSSKVYIDHWPRDQILFNIESPTEHYHIPLLISPYSFTTYRGSWEINAL